MTKSHGSHGKCSGIDFPQDFNPHPPARPRPLRVIAREIRDTWNPPYFGAVPYVIAMFGLDDITDHYGAEEGTEIVQYFLSNARYWRGPVAKRIKAELNAMLKAATS